MYSLYYAARVPNNLLWSNIEIYEGKFIGILNSIYPCIARNSLRSGYLWTCLTQFHGKPHGDWFRNHSYFGMVGGWVDVRSVSCGNHGPSRCLQHHYWNLDQTVAFLRDSETGHRRIWREDPNTFSQYSMSWWFLLENILRWIQFWCLPFSFKHHIINDFPDALEIITPELHRLGLNVGLYVPSPKLQYCLKY